MPFYWPKRQAVQIHMPRTGGTALRGLLTQAWGKPKSVGNMHAAAADFFEDRDRDDWTVIGTIRNPYWWYRSIYRYCRQDEPYANYYDHPWPQWIKRATTGRGAPWWTPALRQLERRRADYMHGRGLWSTAFLAHYSSDEGFMYADYLVDTPQMTEAVEQITGCPAEVEREPKAHGLVWLPEMRRRVFEADDPYVSAYGYTVRSHAGLEPLWGFQEREEA